LIPGGFEVTVPRLRRPLCTVTVSVTCRVKVAVIVVAAFIVMVQGPVPAQPPPLQPTKVDPLAGLAVRVTGVPLV
jgi:hypothetical protein